MDDVRAMVVDDDEIVREIVVTTLRAQGIKVAAADSLASAAVYRRQQFDLIIADVNLPDGLGFDLVQSLDGQSDAAIIYLTSRAAIGDRLRGFATGGDDYIVKPFDTDELAARVAAVLRRSRAFGSRASRLIARRDWTLDLVRRELADGEGRSLPLTRGEFDLLSALVQGSPTALDREYLQEVIGSARASPGLRTIDVMISRIRTKLDEAAITSLRIVTVRGDGYRAELA